MYRACGTVLCHGQDSVALLWNKTRGPPIHDYERTKQDMIIVFIRLWSLIMKEKIEEDSLGY